MGRIFKPTSIVRDANGQIVLDEHGKPKRRERTKNWFIRYYDANGKAHDESTGSDLKSVAEKLLRQREAARDRGEPVGHVGKITFAEAATDIINNYTLNGRRSLKDLKRRIDKHLTPFFRNNRRMASITTADIRAFTVERQEAGASKAEVNRELAVLKRMFTLALEAKTLIYVPHFEMLHENNARQGFFERAEFESVRSHLPPPMRPLMTFAYLTGWRWVSEALPLRIAQVDAQLGIVRLEPGTTKNDRGRTFHYAALTELRDTMVQQLASADQLSREKSKVVGHVFHDANGAPLTEGQVRKAWKAACKAAGYPGKIPHDFRRTAVRNLVRAGVSEKVAMTMTGHKTRAVFDRYDIVNETDKAEAAQKLETFMNAKAAAPATGQVQQFNRRSSAR